MILYLMWWQNFSEREILPFFILGALLYEKDVEEIEEYAESDKKDEYVGESKLFL